MMMMSCGSVSGSVCFAMRIWWFFCVCVCVGGVFFVFFVLVFDPFLCIFFLFLILFAVDFQPRRFSVKDYLGFVFLFLHSFPPCSDKNLFCFCGAKFSF